MSILTTRHDLKTPDHGRPARSREHSCRQLGMRLRSASGVLENSSARVRRSLRCTSITLGILNARAAKHAVPAFLCARSGSYFRSVTGTGRLKSMLAVLAPAPALPLAVRKNYQARMMTISSLTVLSNVVAYACRHFSRQRIGMMAKHVRLTWQPAAATGVSAANVLDHGRRSVHGALTARNPNFRDATALRHATVRPGSRRAIGDRQPAAEIAENAEIDVSREMSLTRPIADRPINRSCAPSRSCRARPRWRAGRRRRAPARPPWGRTCADSHLSQSFHHEPGMLDRAALPFVERRRVLARLVQPVLVLLGARRIDDAGDVARARQHEAHRAGEDLRRLVDRLGRRDVVFLAGLQVDRDRDLAEVDRHVVDGQSARLAPAGSSGTCCAGSSCASPPACAWRRRSRTAGRTGKGSLPIR